MPAVVLGTDAFISLGRTVGQALGLPHLPLVTVAHPIGGVDPATVAARADAIVDRVLAALTADPAPPASFTAGRAGRVTAPDDLDGFQAFVVAEGWGDGLPALHPTPERVARILGSRRPTEVVATLAPRQGLATFEAVAANAALAGAAAEHLEVIVAAVRAVAEPRFNLKAIQTTTHPCTPLIIVNGPVARRLGIAGGANALGQGSRANAVIGRALRLTLQNVGGASPGQVDRATLGHAGKFTYCLSENEEGSPWEPLHVERGFRRDESTVTVCGSEAPHNVNDHGSTTAEGLMCALASTGATSGNNNVYLGWEPLLLIGPEHAATIAGDGWSKRNLKRAFWDRARVPLSAISPENLARFIAIDPARFHDRAPGDTVPLAVNADDVMVVVAGGPGKHSAVVPTFGATRSVTVRIEDR